MTKTTTKPIKRKLSKRLTLFKAGDSNLKGFLDILFDKMPKNTAKGIKLMIQIFE